MKIKDKTLGKVSVTVEKEYHSLNKEYNKLTIVEEKGAFKTYVSRKPVPLGIQLTNREYWIPFSGIQESIVIDYNKFKQEFLEAEALRVIAENERNNNETNRVNAENQRNQQELSRQNAETTRSTSESNRITNEDNRIIAENERLENENYRTEFERERTSNENSRKNDEISRRNNETSRNGNETNRQQNEAIRQQNEETRQQNEILREQQEGSSNDTPSATGSRWARYKKAENDRTTLFNQTQVNRQTSYNEEEGTPNDTASGNGSRWARFKKAEETRDALVDAKVADITNLQNNKADKDANATEGHVAVFDSNGNPIDSNKSIDDMDSEFSTGEKVSETGIDLAPTAGSDNLVKSGGVSKAIDLFSLPIANRVIKELYMPNADYRNVKNISIFIAAAGDSDTYYNRIRLVFEEDGSNVIYYFYNKSFDTQEEAIEDIPNIPTFIDNTYGMMVLSAIDSSFAGTKHQEVPVSINKDISLLGNAPIISSHVLRLFEGSDARKFEIWSTGKLGISDRQSYIITVNVISGKNYKIVNEQYSTRRYVSFSSDSTGQIVIPHEVNGNAVTRSSYGLGVTICTAPVGAKYLHLQTQYDGDTDSFPYVTVFEEQTVTKEDLEKGNIIPAMAETLAAWADQKAIVTPDIYTDAVRTTGSDIPIETSAGSKLESIKPVAGSKWTAKLLFNGSYNMLNAAKWGYENNVPEVGGRFNYSYGGSTSSYWYFLVPKLTLGTFGTADENNGLLFTKDDNTNEKPNMVYFKPLADGYPSENGRGTLLTPISVSYDRKTYWVYETPGLGWLSVAPITNTDFSWIYEYCAHIAWEDWYDKYISLNEPTTNPEAVVGILMLEGLLALAHSDKYLRGVNEEVCDNVVFGETSATISHMVDEIEIAANAWTNSATGESDSQGNALYRHSATVSGIKNGGAACVEGEDGGIPLTVNGTTVSYIDTNATAPASVVFYQIPTTGVVEKEYTDNVFSSSNIDVETGVLPINDCSIEAQVAIDGKANITVKYAKNIVDQVAINAATDVPKLQEQVEEHEERITELEDTAVRTGSYDASVAVGLADNFKGDTIVDAEFYKCKTGGTQSVGSGIAAIKEVRGKSIVWNQLVTNGDFSNGTTGWFVSGGGATFNAANNVATITDIQKNNGTFRQNNVSDAGKLNHKIYITFAVKASAATRLSVYFGGGGGDINIDENKWTLIKVIKSIMGVKYPEFEIIFNKDGALTNTGTIQFKNINIIDPTFMFGAGNEPATVEEFEKMFPLDYYDYNAGEVIPFAGQNLVTTGKNQYNPATGKANLLGSQTYQLLGTYTSATIDEVAVTLDSNDCFTTTKDCVLEITGGNDTDTFVGLYNGETNTYEPYEKHTLPLDPSQWRDKDGNLVYPYGGMHGRGNKYDYCKVESDGYIRNVVRVFERRAYESGDAELTNVITDGRTYTFYALAEPVEVELTTPVYAKYLVDKDGTEEITPVNGTKPYTTMANLSILYAMDARGEIKNLSKNHPNKGSIENMLNAMVSAGIIASYTMTWDSSNNRYVFTFTKAEEASTNSVNNESNI